MILKKVCPGLIGNIRFVRKYFSIFLLCFFLVPIQGCGGLKLIKPLYLITQEKVKVKKVKVGDKSVVFLGLKHFGKIKYYENLHNTILNFKEDGYHVFYEGVGYSSEDSLGRDLEDRYFRRLKGSLNTRDYYESLTEDGSPLKKHRSQPTNEELGIDINDTLADVTRAEMVAEYESKFGKIHLDSCDYTTHLDSSYICDNGMIDMEFVQYLTLDFRNQNLVNDIINSGHDKILVVYGLAHWKGVKKLLKASR